MNFLSTFSSLDKCIQFGFTHVSLSRRNARSSRKSGFIRRTSTNKDSENLAKSQFKDVLVNRNYVRVILQRL